MDPLLMLLLRQEPITREQALNIPGFAGCINFITGTVAGLPVKLYRCVKGEVEEIVDDPRPQRLNGSTGDLMSGYQLKQALTADLLIEGGGYAYIKRRRNTVTGLHYVARQHLSFLPGTDPIYKSCGIMVGGVRYHSFEFLKATRKSADGVRGTGILAENWLPLAVAYNTLKLENVLAKTGGNRRGYLKVEKKLDDKALDALEERWKRFNSEDSIAAMILNAGVDFKETSATPEQMQINQRAQTIKSSICGLFGVCPSVLGESVSEEDYAASIKTAVLPVLAAIEAALNHDLLLETEKSEYYLKFDTKELLRGSVEKRYQAYKAGIESNVLQIDEARRQEDLPPLGLTFIKLGLQDVLYDPIEKIVFVPNTGMTVKIESPSGGGENTG